MNTKGSDENKVADEMIMNRIYVIRGKKVMIDEDLCKLYHIGETRIKTLAVKHADCFPEDFMFQLNREDYSLLASQDRSVKRAAANHDLPLAFTEQGLAMLSGMLRSNRSIAINIRIIRIFTMIRELLPDYSELSIQLAKLTGNLIRLS